MIDSRKALLRPYFPQALLGTTASSHRPAYFSVAFASTQHYSSVVIPPFEHATGNLPPGEHLATLEEISERFAQTQWRRQLLDGLNIALVSLRAAGCKAVYLDGSFVTAKVQPGDFDACWDAEGVTGALLDWELRTEEGFANGRAAQKIKYKGELFPANVSADGLGMPFREFFQRDRDGNPKGISVIILKELP